MRYLTPFFQTDMPRKDFILCRVLVVPCHISKRLPGVLIPWEPLLRDDFHRKDANLQLASANTPGGLDSPGVAITMEAL
jgi:hypothetical protein